ncbi:hypothetical protein VPH35_070466 [Triticum aestivum]
MGMPKLALVILVAAFLAGSGTTKGDCEYRVKVKTGLWPPAGTEAFVEFRLYGDNLQDGSPVVTHWEDDRDGARFNRGSTDEFSFTDPRCIRPCLLVLTRERQDWVCNSVDVTVSGDISYSKLFRVGLVESGSLAEIDECEDAVRPSA